MWAMATVLGQIDFFFEKKWPQPNQNRDSTCLWIKLLQPNLYAMELTKITYALMRHPLFAGLSHENLDFLAHRAKFGKTERYQFIYMPDETSTQFYLLLSGTVKLGYFKADGREVIKEMVKPGTTFGESVILDNSPRPDFAQAQHEQTTWLAIQSADFQRLMRENFSFTLAFLKFLNQRLNQVEDRVNSLILKDARSRIVAFLHKTAGCEGRKFGHETLVKHHLTQQDIASLTGTSRQTVTSVLNELKKNNLIHFNRTSFLIRDLEKLA